jgi:hypothetical protein
MLTGSDQYRRCSNSGSSGDNGTTPGDIGGGWAETARTSNIWATFSSTGDVPLGAASNCFVGLRALVGAEWRCDAQARHLVSNYEGEESKIRQEGIQIWQWYMGPRHCLLE